MGTLTPNLGLYKPSVGERGWGTLVNDNWDDLDNLFTWTSYTPDIDTSGSDVNLGSGAVAQGAYLKLGKTGFVKIRIVWGGAGLSVGTGNYRLTLPAGWTGSSNEVIQASGTGYIYDSSVNDTFPVMYDVRTTTYAEAWISSSTNAGQWSATFPAAPAQNDEVHALLILSLA